MRVLFLTTDFVWPPDGGGRVRTVSQLRVLASLPEVTGIRLFSVHEGEIRAQDRDALRAEIPKLDLAPSVFHPVHLFRHPRFVPRVAWLRVARGVPYIAAKWDSRAVHDAIARELAATPYEVVWLNGLGIARYIALVRERAPRARIVLDGHNVESDRFIHFAASQHGPLRVIANVEARAARRFEREALRSVDAVGAISSDDAHAYRALADVDAVAVPQAVAQVPRVERLGVEPRFCWVGSLGWAPNASGLDWFCAEVWPRVRARLPSAVCEIVGSGLALDARGAPIVPSAWRVPGIETLGRVEDLAPVYARSLALVAPIASGAGIRIKLLEAFRYGIPAVTTPEGAAGLPITAGREALVESEAQAFADRMVALATQPALRVRLAAAGRTFLERHNRLEDAQAAVRALLGCATRHAAVDERTLLAQSA